MLLRYLIAESDTNADVLQQLAAATRRNSVPHCSPCSRGPIWAFPRNLVSACAAFVWRFFKRNSQQANLFYALFLASACVTFFGNSNFCAGSPSQLPPPTAVGRLQPKPAPRRVHRAQQYAATKKMWKLNTATHSAPYRHNFVLMRVL